MKEKRKTEKCQSLVVAEQENVTKSIGNKKELKTKLS